MILYGLNFCECFCGNVCVNRYVNHHWGKGRQLPEETKKKQSLARLGKEPWNKGKTEVYKEETLEKIREARAKQVFSEESNRKRSESMKGRPCSNKGYKHTEEWKEENSKRMKQFWEDGVFTPHEAWNKGLHTEGHLHTEEAKRKMSELAKGKPKTEEHKRHLSEVNLGKKHTEEHKRKQSISQKEIWDNYSESEKNIRIKNMKTPAQISPNKLEQKLQSILDELFHDEYKFVGDFSVVIDGKSPDFININGQKKIIELFGDYYHRGQDSHDRINIFKPYGYQTLIIWEKELKDIDSLKERLIEFHESVMK